MKSLKLNSYFPDTVSNVFHWIENSLCLNCWCGVDTLCSHEFPSNQALFTRGIHVRASS